MHVAKPAAPAIEPVRLSPRAFARWHKDDSVEALARYVSMTPLTALVLHAYEVVDAELQATSVKARTHARKTAHTRSMYAGGEAAFRSLGVGRTSEPQSRTYMDDEGLQRDGDAVPFAHHGVRRIVIEEVA